MTILETERLLLQQANLDDSSFIFKLLNSPNWVEFIGDRGIKTVEDAGHYIQNALIKSYEENKFGLYKIILKKEKHPIGLCGLLQRPNLKDPDIGFAILPQYEGNGYAFEAAKATMAHAISTLGLSIILGITTDRNIKSKKLLKKLGMRQIDTIKFKTDEVCLLYENEKM